MTNFLTLQRRLLVALLAILVAATAASCGGGPGGGDEEAAGTTEAAAQPADISKLGDVTLLVWDQEVRGGQNQAITRLNKDFQQKYPNVTIKRVAKSFTDLNTTLKLAASGPNPPDVVQANQGWSIMGPLVKAKLLQPLDRFADQYGWEDRFSSGLLAMNSFAPDGASFGTGKVFGLSQAGEVVGVFYNRAKLRKLGIEQPTTFAEFEGALAKAKAGGEVPIQFGNLDKWPGIHEFEVVATQTVPKEQLRDFIFGRGDASFDTEEVRKAAATLQGWARKGYFTPGFNGLGYDNAWKQFANGKGVFFITGSWLNADLVKTMRDGVGFFLVPPAEEGGDPVALGGQGLAFSVTSKADHPEVAAAYIDFITSARAAKTIAGAGLLPAMEAPKPASVQEGTSLAQIYDAWDRLNEEDGIVPYLDWATPTMYDVFTGAVQELMAGKATPEQFASRIQADHEKFHAGK